MNKLILPIVVAAVLLGGCIFQPDPVPARIQDINRAVNSAVEYKNDTDTDFWQYPDETLRLMTGDCEDYAVLKWHFLGKGLIHVVSVDGVHHAILEVCEKHCYFLDNRYDYVLSEQQKYNIYGQSLLIITPIEALSIKRP